jgi:hypothetical protein
MDEAGRVDDDEFSAGFTNKAGYPNHPILGERGERSRG